MKLCRKNVHYVGIMPNKIMSGLQVPGLIFHPELEQEIFEPDVLKYLDVMISKKHNIANLVTKKRTPKYTNARTEFIKIAYFNYNITQTEIAHYLGLVPSTINYHINEKN